MTPKTKNYYAARQSRDGSWEPVSGLLSDYRAVQWSCSILRSMSGRGRKFKPVRVAANDQIVTDKYGSLVLAAFGGAVWDAG
jgi:hypothetical protein